MILLQMMPMNLPPVRQNQNLSKNRIRTMMSLKIRTQNAQQIPQTILQKFVILVSP